MAGASTSAEGQHDDLMAASISGRVSHRAIASGLVWGQPGGRDAPRRRAPHGPTDPSGRSCVGESVRVLVAFLCLGVATARAEAPTHAALSARAAALEKKLDGKGFSVLVEAPFVLVGDEGPDKLRQRARTVRWTRRLLMNDYFAVELDRALEVWLFKDEKTYRRGAKDFFGDEPDTPYGYYSAAAGALVMNIGPGAGTLVHELVHPYLERNFPEVPAWFDEGLASLYERPTEVGGHIRGLPNWRLPALKREIRTGKGRSLTSLMSTSRDEFYEAADNTYARARYLCYYLQEKGLLVAFYRRFKEHQADDPTGIAALRAVLDTDDLDGFEKIWSRFVLALDE